jgi:hypothetical protein
MYVQWFLQSGFGVKGMEGYCDVNGTAVSICLAEAYAKVMGGAMSVGVAEGDGNRSEDVPRSAFRSAEVIIIP